MHFEDLYYISSITLHLLYPQIQLLKSCFIRHLQFWYHSSEAMSNILQLVFVTECGGHAAMQNSGSGQTNDFNHESCWKHMGWNIMIPQITDQCETCISKILEQLLLIKIVSHISTSPNFDVVQSAYRRHHSTAMAVLKMADDIFTQIADYTSCTQSAAFEWIDHMTLIRRLNHSFRVMGESLDLSSSYLEFQSTFIRWKQVSSSVQLLETGVLQVSVLVPLLFYLYNAFSQVSKYT